VASDELVPFGLPAERAPGVPFNDAFPRNPPDAAAQALMRALAEAGSEEEACRIYLSAVVRAGIITEAEADEIRAEAPGALDGQRRGRVGLGAGHRSVGAGNRQDEQEGRAGMSDKRATDILVRTGDPALLDRSIQQLGPAVVLQGHPGPVDYVKVDGCYVVSVYGDPGFIKFAITNQGYGEVVRELDELV
jgi:hypothetical protein